MKDFNEKVNNLLNKVKENNERTILDEGGLSSCNDLNLIKVYKSSSEKRKQDDFDIMDLDVNLKNSLNNNGGKNG